MTLPTNNDTSSETVSSDDLGFAKECGAYPETFEDGSALYTMTNEQLSAFAAKIRESEREACAAICDQYPQRDPGGDGNGYWAAEECAMAIRARSKP
jgi:hypothetical protein